MDNNIIIISFLSINLICLIYYVIVNNTDVELRNLANKKYEEIEVYYDRLWKTIQQKAQVTNNYKEGFMDIYIGIMENRYSNNKDSVINWIKEDNPNFDIDMYQDLMNTIEIERTSFQKIQSQMLDIIREHNNLIDKIPSKFFLSNKERIIYVPLTSTKTKNVVSERIDDNINVF